MGEGILVLMTAPPRAHEQGPRYQCEGNHPAAHTTHLPVLQLDFQSGTPISSRTLSRTKTSFR